MAFHRVRRSVSSVVQSWQKLNGDCKIYHLKTFINIDTFANNKYALTYIVISRCGNISSRKTLSPVRCAVSTNYKIAREIIINKIEIRLCNKTVRTQISYDYTYLYSSYESHVNRSSYNS